MPEMWQREVIVCQRCGKNIQGHDVVAFDSLTASVQEMALTVESPFFQKCLGILLCIFDQ